jgi:hypothetical protein
MTNKPEAKSECICGEINARHCPIHNEPTDSGAPREVKTYANLAEALADKNRIIEAQALELKEAKGALDLKNDDYVRQVGTWKIIQRLEEQVKDLEQANAKLIAEIDSLKLQQLVKPQTEEKI